MPDPGNLDETVSGVRDGEAEPSAATKAVAKIVRRGMQDNSTPLGERSHDVACEIFQRFPLLFWRDSMESAPRDGTPVFLLSCAHEEENPWPEGDDDKIIKFAAKVAVGCWSATGDAWVDEHGLLSGDCYTLATTGTWHSGGGWFEPNEVTHWMPMPWPPEAALKVIAQAADTSARNVPAREGSSNASRAATGPLPRLAPDAEPSGKGDS